MPSKLAGSSRCFICSCFHGNLKRFRTERECEYLFVKVIRFSYSNKDTKCYGPC